MLTNKKGFTLIELMIVIAIIGILAAIAIPNFIEYRNKSYCSRAESDANNVAAAISDYYSIPSHTAMITTADVLSNLSGNPPNTFAISGTITNIIITVTDASQRCPTKYKDSMATDAATKRDGWTGNTHVKYMAVD